MKQKILNVWNWLVTSSANPQKVSLTILGIGGTIASYLITLLPIFHIAIVPGDVNAVVQGIAAAAVDVLGFVSICATIYGGARKIILTAEGKLPTTPTV